MRSTLALLAVALLGLFGATSIGYASYRVSRDSVGLPVTKLKLSPNQLAPATTTTRKTAKPKRRKTSTSRTTRTTTTPRVTTTDDHGGSGRSGKGSDDSGRGSDD